MNIGTFQNAVDGRITGEFDALGVGRVKLTFEPNSKGADYTVITTENHVEVGAAWKKTAKESGKAYISVRLDSPFLAKPINVALFPAKEPEHHVLVWDRPERKPE
jgi:uncharacterized protein (DUF736 family)